MQYPQRLGGARIGLRPVFVQFLQLTVMVKKALEHGSLDGYLWSFVGGRPIVNRRREPGEVPAKTGESDLMSKTLKKRGFRFVGSTICYAFMQATGMVNDHLVSCFRYKESRRAEH